MFQLDGEVWLVGDHHRLPSPHDSSPLDTLRRGGQRLNAKMLEWPLYCRNGEAECQPWLDFSHAVLRALSIKGLVSVISFGAGERREQLYYPECRVWGAIYLEQSGKRVISFTHHTELGLPYVHLTDWIEDDEERTRAEWAENLQFWRSGEAWDVLIRKRISAKVDDLNETASRRRAEAETLQAHADSILELFLGAK